MHPSPWVATMAMTPTSSLMCCYKLKLYLMKKISPKEIPSRYYSFANYNTPVRIITYWHQLNEVISVSPVTVLEVGIGSKMVSSYLRAQGIDVDTLDVNKNLGADIVGDVRNLEALTTKKYDVVLCARVLHHLPFVDLEKAVSCLLSATRKRLIITLPVNDFRFYLIMRYTSSKFFTFSFPLPLVLKKILARLFRKEYGSGLWMLDDSKYRTVRVVSDQLKKQFSLTRSYRISEDRSHIVFVFDLE
jgi:uncharacterized UPF0146 family protein